MTAAELRWMLATTLQHRKYPGPRCSECHCEDCMPFHPKDRCAIRLALDGPQKRPRAAPRGNRRIR